MTASQSSEAHPRARGLNSSTFQLNLSRLLSLTPPTDIEHPAKRAYVEPKTQKGDECKPLPRGSAMATGVASATTASFTSTRWGTELKGSATPTSTVWCAVNQGLTLVHSFAQHKRFLWDRGSILGLLRGCYGGTRGYSGVLEVFFV